MSATPATHQPCLLPTSARCPVAPRGIRSRLVQAAGAGLLLGAAGIAGAADLNNFGSLTQQEFRLLSEDFGATLSYKGLVPAESLGVTGFDISVGVTGAEFQHADLLRRVAGDVDLAGTVAIPSLRVVKGLPGNVDIGGYVAGISSTDARLIGAELRWAFIEGNTVLPAVAVRGAATKITGVDQLDFMTGSIDISVSKGILNFTPYGGIGRIWVKSEVDPALGLQSESLGMTRVFAGVNVNLGLNLAIEVDRTGDLTTYGVKAGIRF